MENVRKLFGNVFIQTRGDYGGTFRGDITLINCTLDGTGTYRSNTGGTYDPSSKNATGYIVNMGYSADGKNGYWDWFFGFESYMPSNMTIQNFTSGCTGYTYVYNSLGDDVFTAGKYPLHLAESVTFIDMKPLPICAGIEDLTEMSKIKVYTKKSDE